MIARLDSITYSYPRANSPALLDVTASIAEGAFVLLAGPSAGGKSTLLRVFNGLVPQFHGGTFSGMARVAGLDPARTPSRRMATIAGMVFQEPESQAIADTVEDEIAFGMEQQGVAPDAMRRRIDALLASMRVEHLRFRRLATLSGGERQRIAIASVVALEPRILLLDEPVSQLDPAGADATIETVARLHREQGITVFCAEHRLERLLPLADTVLQVNAGRVTSLMPREAAASIDASPAVARLGHRLGMVPVPLSVDEARQRLSGSGVPATLVCPLPAALPSPGDELLSLEGLSVAYGELLALRDVAFSLGEGEIVALVGPNGSGKSTLFRALAGLARPATGEIRFSGLAAPPAVPERTAFAGLVPQDPALAFYHETVRREVEATLRLRRLPRTAAAVSRWGLDGIAGQHPRDLSTGQQQRVAIAAMLAHEPRVWLLDEPTRGADPAAKAWLAARLHAHAAAGNAAIVATHDVEAAARFATRVIGLDEGRISFDLPVRAALGTGGPLPTQVARVVPGALLPEEVVAT
ncbi:MAG: ATP-binding cassette domain-containing protein [Thermoflexaceae bacterium]|nr:ATP-binding cassette domain-containing protein [Thermoflexaceae bacterium]